MKKTSNIYWFMISSEKYRSNNILDLPGVENSVRHLEDKIKKTSGINIFSYYDQACKDLVESITREFSKIAEDDFVIFSFCGHGQRDKQLLFLLTNDSDRDTFRQISLPLSFIVNTISNNHVKHSILVLDCCYSGVATAMGEISDVLTGAINDLNCAYTISSTKATEECFTAKINQQSFSPFTYFLAEAISSGVLNECHFCSFGEYFNNVKSDYIRKTGITPTEKDINSMKTHRFFPNNKYNKPTSLPFEITLPSLNVLLVKTEIKFPIKDNGDFGVPLGLWLLKSYISKSGLNINIQIYDERLAKLQNEYTDFENEIENFDVVAVSVCSCEVPPAIEKLKISKEKNKVTIIGGIFAFSNEEYLLSYDCIDYVIPGVGTYPLKCLLEELYRKKLKGLGLGERINLTNVYSRENKRDASLWTTYALSGIDFNFWNEINFKYGSFLNGKIDIFTSRGCDMACSFCSVQRETQRTPIPRDAESVIEEIKYLYSLGFRYFSIKDEDFFMYTSSRMLRILSEFIQYSDIKFKIRSRIDRFLKSGVTLGELATLHVDEIQYGVESPNNELLKYVQKGYQWEQKTIDFLKDHYNYNITVNASFILGLALEDEDYYKKLIDFIGQLYQERYTKIYMNFFTPHPANNQIQNDNLCIVSNDLNYYTHKNPVCFPLRPKMKVVQRELLLEIYDTIRTLSHSDDYNPAIAPEIKDLFLSDPRRDSIEIMHY